jgi:hypothetical protein
VSDNVRRYKDAIERARNGDAGMEKFLRMRLATTAATMPLVVLLEVSEALLDGRRGELRNEAERN